jgi:hypothetical protein
MNLIRKSFVAVAAGLIVSLAAWPVVQDKVKGAEGLRAQVLEKVGGVDGLRADVDDSHHSDGLRA